MKTNLITATLLFATSNIHAKKHKSFEVPSSLVPSFSDLEWMLKGAKDFTKPLEMFQSPIACSMCSASLQPLDFVLENKVVQFGLEYIAAEICKYLDIEGGEWSVCKGGVDAMTPFLLDALAEGILSPSRVCDEYLHLCKNPHITELSADAFVKRQLDAKPDFIKNNDFIDKLYAKIKADPNPRRIVRSIQLSDPHIDFGYTEGSAAECNYPICCRDNGENILDYKGRLAGKWGDYNCDIPQRVLESMFEFIATHQNELQTRFITWVGDNSAHNIWSQNDELIAQYTATITDSLKNALKNTTGIEIFPALGNHDTWPVNV